MRGRICCSVLQLEMCYWMLTREIEEMVKHEEVMKYKDATTWTTTLFQVEAKALHYMQALGI